jgi:polyphosphate kinase 2 PPK2
VRVHQLAAEHVWSQRYAQIIPFEKLLIDTNTIVLKFFLPITLDAQEERLLAREENPVKSWKLAVNDWLVREPRADYQSAYENAIGRCSTPHAPWHIVPAHKKCFCNLAMAEAIVKTLRAYRPNWETQLEQQAKNRAAALKDARAAGSIPKPGASPNKHAGSFSVMPSFNRIYLLDSGDPRTLASAAAAALD